MVTELIWNGKYKDGKMVAPVRIALPFQTTETMKMIHIGEHDPTNTMQVEAG